MKEVKAFKCDYCHRCFGRPVDAFNHENRCRKGPNAHHCQTCVNGISAIIEYVPGFSIGYQVAIYGPWCKHHEKPIHEKPYLIECDEDDGGGWHEARPVPGTCWEYAYKGFSGWPQEGDIS